MSKLWRQFFSRGFLRDLLIVLLLPITTFFKNDIDYFANTGVDAINYILQFTPAIVCLLTPFLMGYCVVRYIKKRDTAISIRLAHSCFLILIVYLNIAYTEDIRAAREVVEFYRHEQALSQLIPIAKTVQITPPYSLECPKYMDLPPLLQDSLGHRTMSVLSLPNTLWIGLMQRDYERATNIFYIEGNQPRIGETVYFCANPAQCYYQIKANWFLCHIYGT